MVQRLIGVLPRTYADGWQPADLLRVVRRRLGRRPAALLASLLAGELDGYAADTVDPRWREQLLDAREAPPQPVAALLSGAAATWPGGGSALALAAAQLEALLQQLRPVEVIGPLPGAGRIEPSTAAAGPRGAGSTTGAQVDRRVLERVRAMLAKAESTTYPAEAEAFTAAAQSLMARHSIDAAVLAATARGAGGAAPGAGPACTRIGVEDPHESAKALLLQAIAEANRCSTVWSSAHGSSTVIGFPADLLAVEVLFTSLLVQATARLAALGTASGCRQQPTRRPAAPSTRRAD